MELARLKQFAEARPFKPFKLVLPSDREVDVPHPEFISIAPTGNAAVVWHKNGVGEHIDLRWIVSVKTNGVKRT
jgi:hypothetical protein